MSLDDAALSTVGSLQEPQRRRLYAIVAARPEGAGREEAAQVAGISRSLAAYHLDRLVEDGLLTAEYRRLTGRTGPGAGRPAKVYRRADQELHIAIPPRDYELAARLLAAALDQRMTADASPDLAEAVTPAAGAVATRVRDRVRDRGASSPAVPDLLGVLGEIGYEPCDDGDGAVRLRNCPFHALTRDHLELICGLNHTFLSQAICGAELDGSVRAQLRPEHGQCCVVLDRVVNAADESG